MEQYRDHSIHHLPRIGSDHNPLLLTDGPSRRYSSQNFRFKNTWLIQPGFHYVAKSGWEPGQTSSTGPEHKLSNLTTTIMSWKSLVFGTLSVDIRKLIRQITRIQYSNKYPTSSFLQNLRKELLHEHYLERAQQEIFWPQRSRVQWLTTGDCNTRFFRRVTKENFGRKHIHCLMGTDGTHYYTQEEM